MDQHSAHGIHLPVSALQTHLSADNRRADDPHATVAKQNAAAGLDSRDPAELLIFAADLRGAFGIDLRLRRAVKRDELHRLSRGLLATLERMLPFRGSVRARALIEFGTHLSGSTGESGSRDPTLLDGRTADQVIKAGTACRTLPSCDSTPLTWPCPAIVERDDSAPATRVERRYAVSAAPA